MIPSAATGWIQKNEKKSPALVHMCMCVCVYVNAVSDLFVCLFVFLNNIIFGIDSNFEFCYGCSGLLFGKRGLVMASSQISVVEARW
jgi:hypothetical protein